MMLLSEALGILRITLTQSAFWVPSRVAQACTYYKPNFAGTKETVSYIFKAPSLDKNDQSVLM